MINKFNLDDQYESPKLESIFFVDEVGIREILPNELRAFLDFKDQLWMMSRPMNEMPFTDLVSQARELEKTFKKCMKVLKTSGAK